MRLTDDGLGNSDCGLAQPTGDLVERVLGLVDVYGSVADYVRSTFPNGRGTLFGWDWRKRPQESFSRLRAAIADALDRDGPWKDQDAGRVVLWSHSYGGLLARSFVAGADGQKVARVLTEGMPVLGLAEGDLPARVRRRVAGLLGARRADQQRSAEGLRRATSPASTTSTRATATGHGSRSTGRRRATTGWRRS